MKNFYSIQEIWQKDESTLGIIWSDGLESSFNVVDLRRSCPCAVCVDEMTGKRKLLASEVASSVRPVTVKSVGRYALNVEFNDGHNTGIYSFESLRRSHDAHS
ncbi:MAG: DUF971 domain-containing protein [Oligoflexales bacterium]